MQIYNNITSFITLSRNIFKYDFYGFIAGHSYLNNEQIKLIKESYRSPSNETVFQYEEQFARLVGGGSAISYASGRMGFYSLMKLLGIGINDEVLLPAATCSVMVNAILRIGATPVYADIDKNTFGSDVKLIKSKVSKKTRMIVAQHSFGIPCNIDPIVKYAKNKKIFLLEDCALTLDSVSNGESVGNFGDAALFSTDRSKPLNTITGGLIYSKNVKLILKLKEFDESAELPNNKQKAIFDYFRFQLKYYNEKNVAKFFTLYYLRLFFKKLFQSEVTTPFLDEDFSTEPSKSYPYPSKLPPFLAKLGQFELDNWNDRKIKRAGMLEKFISISIDTEIYKFLPSAYFDSQLEIIPHRIVWSQDNGKNVREDLSLFIDVSWTWFLKPIIATKEPLQCFNYTKSSCPVSEEVGPNMVNLPLMNDLNVKNYLSRVVTTIID
jgi:perosamine synthetase